MTLRLRMLQTENKIFSFIIWFIIENMDFQQKNGLKLKKIWNTFSIIIRKWQCTFIHRVSIDSDCLTQKLTFPTPTVSHDDSCDVLLASVDSI